MMLDYGVTFIDPKNTYVSGQASIGRDTIIYPNVSIEGGTVIGDGCTIRQERASPIRASGAASRFWTTA
jgi:bifunctional N-acetylglucosamine-1-phosphate-uridyltransferase/glucosamine-1-phosphate-acetyltransferase GlmU-like protein